MKRVLVTGATGFIGRELCPLLAKRGFLVRAAVRKEGALPEGAAEQVSVGEITANTEWTQALHSVDHVVHLAARAHVLGDAPENCSLYLQTNAHGTQRLAMAAGDARVERFVYLSSVKVNGEATVARAFRAGDRPHPQDAYGVSKWRGEEYLRESAAQTGLKAVIVRSPLVYGPRVRANFLRLLQWVDRGWPLPFGAIRNVRSLVSVWNICDLLAAVLERPAACGRTWMVSDGYDLSTPELVRMMGAALGRPARLLPVPVGCLRALGAMSGRRDEIARLCGSLAVDIEATREELKWAPPLSVAEGLARTTGWYRSPGGTVAA